MTNAPTLLTVATLAGFSAALALTPLIWRLAVRWRLVDCPDSFRKLHEHPVPLGGGVAVFLSTVLAIGAALLLPHPWQPLLWHGSFHLLGLSIAALIVVGLGLADDCFHLGYRHKLVGQLAAAIVIVLAGLKIQHLQLFDWQVELGVLAIPFTVFWILGAINALNLLDGSDGVASTVGIVLSLALAAMALMLPNREIEAIVALALAGSLIGFLFYNFPPAKVYLGDSGSMLIGLIIGVLALRSGLKAPTTIALATPTALFAIPILDTAMAILRRRLTGRSVYTPDRGHLHHCLLRRGLSRRRTVVWIASLCACTAIAALASVYHRNELLALIGVLAVVGTLIVTRHFGHAESRLLTLRLAQFVRSLLRSSAKDGGQVCEERVYAEQGCRWEAFWNALVEMADRYDVNAVRLNVSVPSRHEEFHAFRYREVENRPNDWQLDLPLFSRQQSIGRLRLRGKQSTVSSHRLLSEFLPRLDELLSTIAADWADRPPKDPSPVHANTGVTVLPSTIALVKDHVAS